MGLILMAWASIERHFFIFYPRFMLGALWKKWMYHIIPIILCILWPTLWYLVLIVFSPNCTNIWDFEYIACGGLPCYTTVDDGIYGILDAIFKIVIPLSLILLANIVLIIRVVYEKVSRRQVVHWGRHRKMVLQLWCISTLYLGVWLPVAVVLLIRLIALPTFLDDQIGTLIYTTNFVPLLLPFVCLGIFPKIPKTIHNVLGMCKRNRVGTDLVRPQIQMRTGHRLVR
jgi:hypothetical protein